MNNHDKNVTDPSVFMPTTMAQSPASYLIYMYTHIRSLLCYILYSDTCTIPNTNLVHWSVLTGMAHQSPYGTGVLFWQFWLNSKIGMSNCAIIGMQSMVSIMCQFWHKTHIPSSHSYLHTYPVTPTTPSHISLTPTHHSLHISSSESHLISHSCTPTPSHSPPSHISLTPTHLHFYLVVNQAVSHGEVLDQVGMVERTLLIVVKLLLDAPP